MLKKGLEPIINVKTKILILGTLPGDKSIELQQYYANKNNDFWKLISLVIDKDISSLHYETKVQALLKHNIGLWDVFQSSNRKGSLDSNLKNEQLNDFSRLRVAPNLRLICFNGKKAGKHEPLFLDLETKILPSSSGANRRYSEQRQQEWLLIQDYL